MENNNKMLIDATHPEETRVVVLRNGRVEEFDYESAARKLAARQHLSGQGHARRAVAAGGLRRLRRQPPRLPGLQRNPSRLLPDPGRRPAGAAAGGGRGGSRGRGRGRCPRRSRGAGGDAATRASPTSADEDAGRPHRTSRLTEATGHAAAEATHRDERAAGAGSLTRAAEAERRRRPRAGRRPRPPRP